jgi:hypothetical protein
LAIFCHHCVSAAPVNLNTASHSQDDVEVLFCRRQ